MATGAELGTTADAARPAATPSSAATTGSTAAAAARDATVSAAATAGTTAPASALDPRRYDQIKTIYDYTKLHFGIYIGTPAALMIFVNELHVADDCFALAGLVIVTVFNGVAALSAGWSMAALVYGGWLPLTQQRDWTDDQFLLHWQRMMRSGRTRFVHHYLYWLGLLGALVLVFLAWRHAHRLAPFGDQGSAPAMTAPATSAPSRHGETLTTPSPPNPAQFEAEGAPDQRP